MRQSRTELHQTSEQAHMWTNTMWIRFVEEIQLEALLKQLSFDAREEIHNYRTDKTFCSQEFWSLLKREDQDIIEAHVHRVLEKYHWHWQMVKGKKKELVE